MPLTLLAQSNRGFTPSSDILGDVLTAVREERMGNNDPPALQRDCACGPYVGSGPTNGEAGANAAGDAEGGKPR